MAPRTATRTNGRGAAGPADLKPLSPEDIAAGMNDETVTEANAPTAAISIQRVNRQHIVVPIIGTAPLIVHAWSPKAKRKMLDAQMGKRAPREPRNPEEEYQAAFYRLDAKRTGMPILAFKSATVGAARFYGREVKMTELRQFLFFDGEFSAQAGQKLTEIHGEARMREDVARLSGAGSTEMRFRPEYPQWTAELDIRYVTSALTLDSVLSLIDAGGMGVGVGEWRVEKRGDFGTYTLDTSKEIQVLDE